MCRFFCMIFLSMVSLSIWATPTIIIRGLEHHDLTFIKQWTTNLYSLEGQFSVGHNVKQKIKKVITQSISFEDLTTELAALHLDHKYSTALDYQVLASTLLVVREQIKTLSRDTHYRNKVLQLLQIMAEESLYVRAVRFKKYDNIYFNFISNKCRRAVLLNGHKVCNGDVIVSKGGAGSSSFLARVADRPGNFSHSTVSYISPEKKLYFIEAFIEDGVKLRTPKHDYIQSKKTKLSAFRLRYHGHQAEINRSVDMMLQRMKEEVNSNSLTGLLTQAAFPYDFAMQANNADKMFCSEVVFHTYNLAVDKSLNPYLPSIWSKVDNPQRYDLLHDILSTTTSFPAPSDIELNKNFQLVYSSINSKKLAKDRIIVALVDDLFSLLADNDKFIPLFVQKIGPLGTEIVQPKELEKYLRVVGKKLGFKLSASQLQQIRNVPLGINYRQLVFFALLDKKLTPEVLYEMGKIEKRWLAQGKIVDLVTMRSLIMPILQHKIDQLQHKLSQL